MLTSLRSHWVRLLIAELQPLTSTNPYHMAANMGRVSINQSPFTWEGIRGNKFTVACNNDGMLSKNSLQVTVYQMPNDDWLAHLSGEKFLSKPSR
jgi:hypothetical protein